MKGRMLVDEKSCLICFIVLMLNIGNLLMRFMLIKLINLKI